MKTYSNLDGINLGSEISKGELSFESNGIECREKESKNIYNVLVKEGAIRKDDGSLLFILYPKKKRNKTAVTITLRTDRRKGNKWFLNVLCNPGSLRSGDNTFGNLKIDTQIQYMFKIVLDFLESKGANVKDLERKVREGDIYLQSITFAQYTKPLENEDSLSRLINYWYFMYENRLYDGSKFVSLLKELGIKRGDGEEYTDSLNLSIFSGQNINNNRHKLMHLCLYNKAEELKSKNMINEDSEKYSDLNKRARLDLTITNYYFNRKWAIPVVTLKSLYEYIEKEYKGDWKEVVRELMNYAFERTCLQYMLNCPNPFRKENRLHIEMWKKGKKRNWPKELITWAKEEGINLDVSPLAHLIMKQGQANALVLTAKNTERWLTGGREEKKKYSLKVLEALEITAENRKLSKEADKLKLDFGKPKYEIF